MPFTKALYCCTITLTTAPQSILALIQAIGGQYANVPSSCRSYNFQSDPANGAGTILLGDENTTLSPQQCGVNMTVGSYFLDRASVPGLAPIGSWFGAASTGTAKLNVMIFGE